MSFTAAGSRWGVAALLLLVLVIGCSRTPAGAIEHVLNECAEVSNGASQQRGDAAEAAFIADYAQTLDTADCPEDFRIAFQAHANAWRQAQMAFVNRTSGNTAPQAAGMRINQAVQNINSTYYKLTEIAARYGARVPRSVVQMN